jgi:spermidine synthase
MSKNSEGDSTSNFQNGLLLVSVFIIATCGILYELLIGSISTYFLGSSVLQFSLSIGLFMFFMGVGSYVSKYVHEQLLEKFILIEIIIGAVGGLSSLILHFTFAATLNYYIVAFLIIAVIGVLIGLEIPIVTRISNQYSSLKDAVANVLSFDYIGALLASILFPLVLLPYLGIMKTSFLVGLLNLTVAFINVRCFKIRPYYSKLYKGVIVIISLVLISGFVWSSALSGFIERMMYQDNIIYAKQTPYQKLVFTKWKNDYRLFINGNLQFSSVDEYRYHESLVHIPMLLTHSHEKILVLGGGDGLAVRELLKYSDIRQIDLVDLDVQMTNLAKKLPLLKKLNGNSMNDPKVNIINQDAFNFISDSSSCYNVIIIDLPDPNDHGLGKLYTREFYEFSKKRLSADGIIITQATSPYFSSKAFWCIKKTMEATYGIAVPVTVNVPSFGQWGFVISGNIIKHYSAQKLSVADIVKEKLMEKKIPLRYLNESIAPTLFVFDNDMKEVETKINTLDTQQLVIYYEESLKYWR